MSHQSRYVIFHHEMGIYLGSCLGLGFWSRLDPVGQPSAVTFPSESVARDVVSLWEDHSMEKDLIYWPVVADEDEYISHQACARQGLPDWDPDYLPSKDSFPEKGNKEAL